MCPASYTDGILVTLNYPFGTHPADAILLTPRPWATLPGKLTLLPLMSEVKGKPRLPSELWHRILCFLFEPLEVPVSIMLWRRSLMTVCKMFKALVSPLFYAYPSLHSINRFRDFVTFLSKCDRQPIGLDRIQYSAPGRWLQVLNLSQLECSSPADALSVDNLLTTLFPITPFLAVIALNETICLSKRAFECLSTSECARRLRELTGIQPPLASLTYRHPYQACEDPIINLLKNTLSLEYLGLRGPGYRDDIAHSTPLSRSHDVPSLCLPKLYHLSIIGLYTASVILSLASSSLPTLRSLTISRFDFLPPQSTFLSFLTDMHRNIIHSLHFVAPAVTFSAPHPLVADPVLQNFPCLTYLSLSSTSPLLPPSQVHPLRFLSIPKPVPHLLADIENLLPLLPYLKLIQFRDVRWLPTTMNAFARASGIPGEMATWKRRLGARGVVVVDSEGLSA